MRHAFSAEGRRIEREVTPARPTLLDEGGRYAHHVVAGAAVRRYVPGLVEWYEGATRTLSLAFGDDVVTSPYPASALTVKHYGPGDAQGWHYDTNPVTVLLWLTDCPEGGETLLVDRYRFNRLVAPRAGSVLLMWGRELRHCVLPQPFGADRVTVAANYYTATDTWRPEGIDEVVYG